MHPLYLLFCLVVMCVSIEATLNNFLLSEKGRKKVQKAVDAARKQGKQIGIIGIDPSYMNIVRDLIKCVQANLPESLQSSELLSDAAYIISKPVQTKDGNYRIDISFDPAAVFRPSLSPNDTWGDGIANIVLHLSNGWHASGTVSGVWHGQTIRSRQTYDGDDFMKQAIFEFNTSHVGATATLGTNYK